MSPDLSPLDPVPSHSLLPNVSPNTLKYSFHVYLSVYSALAFKCNSKPAQIRSPRLHDHGLLVHLETRLVMISEYISMVTHSWHPSVSPNTLDYCLEVHLQPCQIMSLKYNFKERRLVYGDTGVKALDRVRGNIYSAVPKVHRHHIICIQS
jgi:hypothetical protein